MDGDGDLDLALSTLGGLVFKENRGARDAQWTRIRLVGAGPGRPVPTGARVYVTHAGRTRARHVALVEGFQSQVSPDIHVGLGTPDATTVERIEVRWPNGAVDVLEDAPAAKLLVLREPAGEGTRTGGPPEGRLEVRDLPRWPGATGTSAFPTVGDSGWASRLAAIARTPAALGSPRSPLVVRVHATPPPAEPLFARADAGSWNDVRVVDAFLRGAPEAEARADGRTAVFLSPEVFADAIGTAEATTVVYDGGGRLHRVFRGPASAQDIQACVELARAEPGHRHLLIQSGRLALEESRFRDAVSIFKKATADAATLRAQDAPAFEGLGRAYVLLGRVDLAEAAYRSAVDLDPDYAIGHFNLAAAYTQTGRFKKALGALGEARRIEGDTLRVLGATAEAQAGSGDREGAIATAEAWLEDHPDEASMHLLAGLLNAQLERWEKAKFHLEAVLSADPGNQDARSALTSVRRELGG